MGLELQTTRALNTNLNYQYAFDLRVNGHDDWKQVKKNP